MTRTALALGATGGVGGAVARRLAESGWAVRALVRPSSAARVPAGVASVPGDALSAADVTHAAKGADVIVHAVNPPGYRDWHKLVLPMIDNTIAAARKVEAKVLLPGAVYNYGPDAFPLIGEAAPQHPATAKGKIRVELERRLRVAAEATAMTALVVRAGDFFGPGAGNNWFSQGLVKPGARPPAIYNPGVRGVGHQWAYLPDVAETMVQLAGRTDLAPFATFHMEGQWDPDGEQMVTAIVRALGDPTVPIRRCHGGGCGSPGCSRRLRANSSRCAICGKRRSAWSTTGCGRRWEPSRTRRSTRQCGIPCGRSAASIRRQARRYRTESRGERQMTRDAAMTVAPAPAD